MPRQWIPDDPDAGLGCRGALIAAGIVLAVAAFFIVTWWWWA
jgi:hypothetical protein